MTKKDYVLIANVIRELKDSGYLVKEFSARNVIFNWEEITAIENAFIEALKNDNPRFDADKFIKYINEN